MVAAQHMESQVELYLTVTRPSPKDGLLSSFFFPPPLLICLKLQIKTRFFCSSLYFDRSGTLTLHTSVSILLLICCTFPCQPCTCEQSLVPVDHPGSDHKEESRLTIILLIL